ncbi:hypothetical protein A2966_03070 [Candidatus Roizmanbacteria bacterium RIFCSPLOWO2_01_FULL_41_22]|uniref:Uncharacterized protein n=1 Tax=Candidatus Roizmanbacteria bacterium RIFCSPLOWO2_01_FULL_41_22 TaxID=1802067 RepID=A0A1F7J739_9BACT|nr:MAG: hypothetical protein A2966_03070 [Candidatus Roizmanbacteria bacterium RIFCSPLOWO2_01_FULL_41_22]
MSGYETDRQPTGDGDTCPFPPNLPTIVNHVWGEGYALPGIFNRLTEASLIRPARFLWTLPRRLDLSYELMKVRHHKERYRKNWDMEWFDATQQILEALARNNIGWEMGLAGACGDLQDLYAIEAIEHHPNFLKIAGIAAITLGSLVLSPEDAATMQRIGLTLGAAAASSAAVLMSTGVAHVARKIGIDYNPNHVRHAVDGGGQFFLEHAAWDAVQSEEVGQLANWLLGTVPVDIKPAKEVPADQFDFNPEGRLSLIRIISSQEALIGVCAKYLYDNPLVGQAIAHLKTVLPDSPVVGNFAEIEERQRKINKDPHYIEDDDYKRVQQALLALRIPHILYRLAMDTAGGKAPIFTLLGRGLNNLNTNLQQQAETAVLKLPRRSLLNAVKVASPLTDIDYSFAESLVADVMGALEGAETNPGARGQLTEKQRQSRGNRAFLELTDYFRKYWQEMKSQNKLSNKTILNRYQQFMTMIEEQLRGSDIWKQYRRPPYAIQKMLEELHKLEVKFAIPAGYRDAQRLRYLYYARLVENLGNPVVEPALPDFLAITRYLRGSLDKRKRASLGGVYLDLSEQTELQRVVAAFISHTGFLDDGYFQQITTAEINARLRRIYTAMTSLNDTERVIPTNDYELIRRAAVVDFAHYLAINFGEDYLSGETFSFNLPNGRSYVNTYFGRLIAMSKNWSTLSGSMLGKISTPREEHPSTADEGGLLGEHNGHGGDPDQLKKMLGIQIP